MQGEIKDIFQAIRKKAPRKLHSTSEKQNSKKQHRASRVVGGGIQSKKLRKGDENKSSESFCNLHGCESSFGTKSEGLTIYSEEELLQSLPTSGGNSPLCPFDCRCCF